MLLAFLTTHLRPGIHWQIQANALPEGKPENLYESQYKNVLLFTLQRCQNKSKPNSLSGLQRGDKRPLFDYLLQSCQTRNSQLFYYRLQCGEKLPPFYYLHCNYVKIRLEQPAFL